MPIEVFEGRTGPRLIANLPVASGSYATITCELDGRLISFKATYQGGQAGGYAVLSPDFSDQSLCDELRAIAKTISDDRSAKVHNVRRYLDKERYPVEQFAYTHQAATEQIEKLTGTVPVLTSIKYGIGLWVVLPATHDLTRYLIGEVVRWEIFNA